MMMKIREMSEIMLGNLKDKVNLHEATRKARALVSFALARAVAPVQAEQLRAQTKPSLRHDLAMCAQISALSLMFFVMILFVCLRFTPGYNALVVRSGSMVPALGIGDVVINGPPGGFLGGDVKVGTIATFKHGDKLITHRVISINDGQLVTKGDALDNPDAFPVTMDDVVGVELFGVPFVGHVFAKLHTFYGWLLMIVVPSILLLALLFVEILKGDKWGRGKAPRVKEKEELSM